MAQFSDTVDVKRPPGEVWRVLGQPERWFEGYLETRSRSPQLRGLLGAAAEQIRDYPPPDTRNNHLYRTRMKEEVEVRVTRPEAPSLLEETTTAGSTGPRSIPSSSPSTPI
jgi:hypothetical protein